VHSTAVVVTLAPLISIVVIQCPRSVAYSDHIVALGAQIEMI
jgi:hypothetical protein